jgi:hypothetical protein
VQWHFNRLDASFTAIARGAAEKQTRFLNFETVLFRRDQRVRNRVHRESDAILDSNFAHQFCDVRLNRALFDS